MTPSSVSPAGVTHGAAPAGVEPGNEAEVARNIREMFGRIAPRYDLLNRLLSARIDQLWRRTLVRRVRPYLERSESRVLDLCCGTGDLIISLEAEKRKRCGPAATLVLGADFCRPMLTEAQRKVREQGHGNELIEADALHFPLPAGTLDLITIAWGFRNLASYERGLREMHRLLAAGGCLAILEFSQPTNRIWGPLFRFYFRHILPRIGNALSGSGTAYSYLHNSVRRFLTPEELAATAKNVGFQRVEAVSLTGGISVLHLCYKSV